MYVKTPCRRLSQQLLAVLTSPQVQGLGFVKHSQGRWCFNFYPLVVHVFICEALQRPDIELLSALCLMRYL